MFVFNRSIKCLSAICVVFLAISGLAKAGVVTGSPVPTFTTTDGSKDNLLTLASPTFNADLSTYASFTSEVHSLLGVVNNNESDFEYQDASSPDNIHGDIPLPYAMVGRMANGANGTVLYKFVLENGYETAAGGTISADMYFRHDPNDGFQGENAWIGVAPFTDVVPSQSQVANEANFTRVTMKDLFGPTGHGFDTYKGIANLSIPEGLTEFYVAFSDFYGLSDPNPTYSSARLAISSLTVSASLATAPIPGDFDGDFKVDGLDLAQWQGDYGLNGNSDADGDGDSDGADFLAWQRNYGTGIPQLNASAQAVPEPNSVAIIGFALVVIGGVRSRFGR